MACRPVSALLLFVSFAAFALRAQPVALTVNPASREEMRQFYRAIYSASENVPMGWTGSYATGNAGDTSAAFKEATRLRINFLRALVGVPAGIVFNPAYSAADQQAALMQSVNAFSAATNTISLNHTPPATWTFYTAAGADASSKSNLDYGHAGADAINAYVADALPSNATVGHRRWLFFPQTLQMGTGDVPGDGTQEREAANALWILDSTPGGTTSSPRPATRTTAVTYPPAGYVPYQLVWPRWSFSYPGADFSAATVTMTRAGQSIPVRVETLSTAIAGEPTLVWVYDNTNSDSEDPHPRPTADTPYTVTVSGVRINGALQNFPYTVTVFDPDKPGADYSAVTITGSASPRVGAATSYTVAKPGFAASFDWRVLELAAFNKTYTAESGLEGLSAATTDGYAVVQSSVVANGGSAYRLAHVRQRANQILALPDTYFVTDSAASVIFRSRLGIATAIEEARMEISTDEGSSWIPLYTQTGTSPQNSNQPAPTETTFTIRSISLRDYVGRTVNVRLVYAISQNGVAFLPDPANGVGWFIDDLTVQGVQQASPGGSARVSSGNTLAFTPGSTRSIGLQARSVLFGAYPTEWGPILTVAPVTDAPPQGYLANLSVRTTAGTGLQTLIVGFAVSGGSKTLLVRGVGPTLSTFGVGGALSDPKLELYNGATLIQSNDNWDASAAATFGAVGAFNLTANSRDAALVTTLAPASYTAQVSGVGGVTGIALVELYDTAANPGGARLVNVSARSQVGIGGDILITGFNIAGSGPRTLLIRAIGPTLGAFGVNGALADPKLELFGSAGKINENDNWDASTRTTFGQVGAFDLTTNSRDAVLLVTLNPGSYTAQVSGVGNTTGVGLVEVYEVP